MSEHSADFSREITKILERNSGLSSMLYRAIENPVETAVSCISGHQPSIEAVNMANELGAKVDFVGAEDGTEQEKNHHSDNLADVLRKREENKKTELNNQIGNLQTKIPDSKNKKEEEVFKTKLAIVEEKLSKDNFSAKAKSKLSGKFSPVWLAVLRAYAGEYQAVVGGGDCPSIEFIQAIAKGTTKVQKLNSTYVLSGEKPGDISHNYTTNLDSGQIIKNRVIAITDPALEPAPGIEQRADAAFATARVLQALFPDLGPKIAFASYATGPSGKGDLVNNDINAYNKFLENYPKSYPAYGPIQFDAATNERTGIAKLPSFIRALENKEIDQEEINAYESIAGMASIISVQNLEVGNNLVKALHLTWELSVEMGPLILSPDGNLGSVDNPLVASDLSRSEKARSILFTILALSILVESNQVK